MATTMVTKIKFINTLKAKNIVFFTSGDIKKLFNINNTNTLKHLVGRLKKDGIIDRLRRDKYLFLHAAKPASDFMVANFLLFPSYISLESALSYYGIIDQFPYHISSIILGKSRNIKIKNKVLTYSRIKKEYFTGFIKIDEALMATKEKALFDYLYFVYKGLRPVNIINDFKPSLQGKKVRDYLIENADTSLKKFIGRYVKL